MKDEIEKEQMEEEVIDVEAVREGREEGSTGQEVSDTRLQGKGHRGHMDDQGKEILGRVGKTPDQYNLYHTFAADRRSRSQKKIQSI